MPGALLSFDSLSLDEQRKYIVIGICSGLKPGTRFKRQHLEKVLSREKEVIITEAFSFHPQYGDTRDLDLVMGPMVDYGAHFGLENVGNDFEYVVTKDLEYYVEATRALVGDPWFMYLHSLGDKLKKESTLSR